MQNKCKGCGVYFGVFRSDALTCSPRCRQRYKRMCDKITQEVAALDVFQCGECGIIRKNKVRACAVCRSTKTRPC